MQAESLWTEPREPMTIHINTRFVKQQDPVLSILNTVVSRYIPEQRGQFKAYK